MLTLENRRRRMLVFHLPHEYCRGRCTCAEVTVVTVAQHPRTGARAPKQITKRVPGSITFAARERRTGLPDALVEIPDVRAAIRRGDLRLIEQTAEPVATTPASTTVPAPAAAPTAPPTAPKPTTGEHT